MLPNTTNKAPDVNGFTMSAETRAALDEYETERQRLAANVEAVKPAPTSAQLESLWRDAEALARSAVMLDRTATVDINRLLASQREVTAAALAKRTQANQRLATAAAETKPAMRTAAEAANVEVEAARQGERDLRSLGSEFAAFVSTARENLKAAETALEESWAP